MTKTLTILRALPGAGKSTYAEAWVAESPSTRTRINRDDIRFAYYGSYWGETVNELGVTAIELAAMETIMAEGIRDIVSDNTNLKHAAVKPYMELAQKYGYAVEFIDFNVDVEVLVARDSERQANGHRFLGEAVIRDFAKNFYFEGHLRKPPTLED